MNSRMIGRLAKVLLAAGVLLGMGSCTNDINENGAPVELVATFESKVLVADLGDSTCAETGLGTLNLSTVIKRTDADPRFLDVKLTTARISYKRIDGGTVVPATFVQPMSGLIAGGGTGSASGFLVFEAGAFSKAPFVSLLPVNGGRDPETGKTSVGIEINIEVFGETLAGDKVSASTRFPLTICIGCGCSTV